MDEYEQYSREFYYPDEETKENPNFHWEEPGAKQGSHGVIEAFVTGQKVATAV